MKRVFLTGASAGIGLATAKALVANGHQVWGSSRERSRIPELPGLYPVIVDLASLESVRESFSRALEEAKHFDVVINNAGSGHFGPGESIPTEVLQNQFEILLIAQVELCRLALEMMRRKGAGLIINVSSLASRLPVPFMSAYNAAKAAMASFTMTLQVELGRGNIHLVDLQPADIRTHFNDSVVRTESPDPSAVSTTARVWKVIERNMQAAPEPEIVARAIVKLIEQAHPPARLTVGSTFQAKIAPLIFRFLPQGVRVWGLRRYYGIPSGSQPAGAAALQSL